MARRKEEEERGEKEMPTYLPTASVTTANKEQRL